MEQELQARDQQFEQEKLEKDRLELLLKDIQQKVMKGGNADDEQKRKYKNISNKLKRQYKEHEKLVEEKARKEMQLLNLEKEYTNLQDEVYELREAYQLLKEKYESSQREVRDIQMENEIQKEDYLDMLRLAEKNHQLYLGICKVLLSDKEIEIIRGASDWDEEKQEYKLPTFYFKDKELKFPKCSNQAQSNAIIEQSRESRDVVFSQYNTSNSIQAHNEIAAAHNMPMSE